MQLGNRCCYGIALVPGDETGVALSECSVYVNYGMERMLLIGQSPYRGNATSPQLITSSE